MANKIELLAPAGNRDSFLAGVENGADAVYLGGKMLNARQFAGNFDDEQLEKALDYAHARDVNIYLTVNTLISDSELKDAINFVERAYSMGIDGIIVQDLGFAGLVRRLIPDLSLHASTQMTIYNLEGVKLLEKLGFKRVVLARELSFDEIKNIAQNSSMEIEIFIHGALCVCYSGQCLMSSVIGGRSGNRGKCAQPCRMPYSLVGDGKSDGYLLSPKDMCLLDELPAVLDSGVKSLKIEGRMKSPEYVATVVRIYRKYLDKALQDGRNTSKKDFRIDEKDLKDLAQIFNRGGFTKGYFRGKTGSSMMSYEKPKNWGTFLGEVLSHDSRTGTVKIKLAQELSVGDGIEIWTGMGEDPGNIVTQIKVGERSVPSASKGETAVIGRINGKLLRGDKVYKTSDKELLEEARKSFAGKPSRKSTINGRLVVREGKEVSITVWDDNGNNIVKNSGIIPEKAINKPITEERLLAQINKTGDTPFIFNEIVIDLDDGLAVPVSEINNLRRSALEEFEKLKTGRYKRSISVDFKEIPAAGKNQSEPKVSAFFYSQDMAVDYTSLNVERLYLPLGFFLNKEHESILQKLREKGCEVFLWLPSVTRGNYDRLIGTRLPDIIKGKADGLLIGNAGHIRLASEMPELKIFGDYSLNLFNSYSINEIEKLDLKGAALSIELTLEQIRKMNLPFDFEAEVIVYGRLPLMTSEYCPAGSIAGGFCKDRECSGACSREKPYMLKDRKGMEFPVICDRIDCRSVILNSNVLFNIDELAKISRSGVHSLRLVFTDERPEEIPPIVDMHREVIKNGDSGIEKYAFLIDEIKSKGFTKGHYFRGV